MSRRFQEQDLRAFACRGNSRSNAAGDAAHHNDIRVLVPGREQRLQGMQSKRNARAREEVAAGETAGVLGDRLSSGHEAHLGRGCFDQGLVHYNPCWRNFKPAASGEQENCKVTFSRRVLRIRGIVILSEAKDLDGMQGFASCYEILRCAQQ
jgi:hypothetical protein